MIGDKKPSEITSLPMAMLDYFGKRPGDETSAFMTELKALTDSDKAEFRAMLREIGYALPGVIVER